MNHPDAKADGIQRRPESHLLPVNVDPAFVGLEQPEQDLHQGGLAGAVLPQDGVDLARTNLEVDVIIGDDPGESLGDPPRLQDGVTPFHGLEGHDVNLLSAG